MKLTNTIIILILLATTIKAKEDINILVLLPDLQQDPRCYKAAIVMAIDIVNSNEQILKDYQLVPHYRDTKRRSGYALNEWFKIKRDFPPMHFLLGPVEDKVILKIVPALQQERLMQVSFNTNMSELNNYQSSRWSLYHHRVTPQIYYFSKVKTRLLNYFNWKRAALFYDFIYSDSADTIIKDFTDRNITLVVKQDYSPDDKSMIREKLMHLKKEDSRVVLGEIKHSADVMCEAYKQQLFAPRNVWIMRHPFDKDWYKNHAECSEEQLKEAAAYHFTFNYLPIRRDQNVTAENITADEFKNNLMKMKNTSNIDNIDLSSSYAFDSVWAMANLLQKQVDDPNIRNLSDHVYEDWKSASKISDMLTAVKFDGLGGHFSFEGGKFKKERENDVLILQYRKGSYHEVGTFDGVTRKVKIHKNQENLLFIGNKIPKDQMTVIHIVMSYDSTMILVIAIVTSLCIALSLFFLFVNIKFDSHKVIRMSSPHVNSIILCGSFLCYASIILNGLDNRLVQESDVRWVSKASDVLLAVGFTLTFGGFFAKTWRVYKIFTASAKLKKVRNLSASMFLLLGFFLLIDAILFITWYIIAPARLEMLEISNVENILDDSITITYHQQTKSAYQSEFYATFLVVKGLMLVFGLFLAWQTKDVSIDVLNDSKYIGLAVYNVSAISVVGVISLTALRGTKNPQLVYIISSLCVGISTVVSMLLVFLPKVLLVFSKNQDHGERTKSKFSNTLTSTNTINTLVD